MIKITEKDRLSEIFEKQEILQNKIGEVYNQQYINDMSLALMCEIHEILDNTQWKKWKKQQSFNREEYLKELVDAQCFLINLCLAKNITPEEFFNAYKLKSEENIKRQENGY
jgi:dimeric dUTPase (all-alpha-NTP-PPase superfamily)